MEKISYLVDATGESALQIVGNYWEGTIKKAIILLHMMPATKESWNDFADKINKKGWHVLAIDMRGHGESTLYKYDHAGEDISYKNFSEEEHQATIADVYGARNFLTVKEIPTSNIYIGGASIGANLALQYVSKEESAPGAFLLSPGINYKGINTEKLIKEVGSDKRLYLVAAKDDEYSALSVEKLSKIRKEGTKTALFLDGGHGTSLFNTHKEVVEQLIKWLTL